MRGISDLGYGPWSAIVTAVPQPATFELPPPTNPTHQLIASDFPGVDEPFRTGPTALGETLIHDLTASGEVYNSIEFIAHTFNHATRGQRFTSLFVELSNDTTIAVRYRTGPLVLPINQTNNPPAITHILFHPSEGAERPGANQPAMATGLGGLPANFGNLNTDGAFWGRPMVDNAVLSNSPDTATEFRIFVDIDPEGNLNSTFHVNGTPYRVHYTAGAPHASSFDGTLTVEPGTYIRAVHAWAHGPGDPPAVGAQAYHHMFMPAWAIYAAETPRPTPHPTPTPPVTTPTPTPPAATPSPTPSAPTPTPPAPTPTPPAPTPTPPPDINIPIPTPGSDFGLGDDEENPVEVPPDIVDRVPGVENIDVTVRFNPMTQTFSVSVTVTMEEGAPIPDGMTVTVNIILTLTGSPGVDVAIPVEVPVSPDGTGDSTGTGSRSITLTELLQQNNELVQDTIRDELGDEAPDSMTVTYIDVEVGDASKAVRGDINGDDDFNSQDVEALRRYLAGLPPRPPSDGINDAVVNGVDGMPIEGRSLTVVDLTMLRLELAERGQD